MWPTKIKYDLVDLLPPKSLQVVLHGLCVGLFQTPLYLAKIIEIFCTSYVYDVKIGQNFPEKTSLGQNPAV
jgi:hypothetical protein